MSLVNLVQDYKANVPMHMLVNKYKLPAVCIISALSKLVKSPLN